jgi:hypothetical protein
MSSDAAEEATAPPTAPKVAVLPILEAAVFLASLLFALVFWIRLPWRLPDDRDYRAMFSAMQPEGRPGDALAVLPFWAQRAHTYLHGAPFIAYPSLASEPDVERYRRLWVVAQPDLPYSDAGDTLRELDRKLQRSGETRRFGPLELVLYEPRPGRLATFDFRERVGEASVSPEGTPRLEWHEFDYLPRRCLLAPGGASEAKFSYRAVPVSHGIRGGFGVLGNAEPARLVFSIDGREAPPVDLVAGQRGWQHFEVPLPDVGPGDHAVDITLSGRNLCFDAVAF